MKLPDEVVKDIKSQIGHSSFPVKLGRRDIAIVRHCAKVCELSGWSPARRECRDAILKEFGLD